jgi:hypothetical protein
MSSGIPPLPTNLGHAGWHDHEVRGVVVFDLDPREVTIIDLVLLTLGIPVDGDEARLVVTLCAQAVLNPDPRIPPMKLVRLGAAHGSAQSALAIGMAGMQGSYVGMSAIADSARFLHGVVTEVGWEASDEALHAALEARKRARIDVFGYGVPGRPADERFVWISGKLDALMQRPRPWWRMYGRIGEWMARAGRLHNVSGAIGAALLDLGCRLEHVSALACLFTLPPLLGNAYEGAQQRPKVLQRLPEAVVDYVGPPPRESPRARTARETAETASLARPDEPALGSNRRD